MSHESKCLQLAFLSLLLAFAACSHTPSQKWTDPATGMEFIRVPAGDFRMGSPLSEVGREEQEVPHQVTISRDFYLGATEVTQGQWESVMGTSPSWFPECGGNCPVERVNFYDVQNFIAKLEERTGRDFRLPTEAEWEYACRAGATTPFHTGATITSDQANFDGRYPYPGTAPGIYRESPTPVASFPPNRWGFHDMHGNVWEWTRDRHCPYPEETVTDPLGECETKLLVIRGGSWYFDANSMRCALRYTHEPPDLGFSIGFRLVMEPEEGG